MPVPQVLALALFFDNFHHFPGWEGFTDAETCRRPAPEGASDFAGLAL